MNRRIGFFCLFLIAGVSFLHSLSLEDLIGRSRAEALLAGETLTHAQLKNPVFELTPAYTPIEEMLRSHARDLNPSLVIETLRIYAKPERASAEGWTDEERSAIYNVSLALSTLKGLQYFSIRQNDWRTLYETSFVIDGPGSKTPRADLSFSEPPPELTVYASQRDFSFGDNVYEYRYYAKPDSLVFVQVNITKMYWGIIPAVGQNKLRSLVAVIDAGPNLLAYAVSMANVSLIPSIGQRIKDSFTTRTDAILSWFFRSVDAALR